MPTTVPTTVSTAVPTTVPTAVSTTVPTTVPTALPTTATGSDTTSTDTTSPAGEVWSLLLIVGGGGGAGVQGGGGSGGGLMAGNGHAILSDMTTAVAAGKLYAPVVHKPDQPTLSSLILNAPSTPPQSTFSTQSSHSSSHSTLSLHPLITPPYHPSPITHHPSSPISPISPITTPPYHPLSPISPPITHITHYLRQQGSEAVNLSAGWPAECPLPTEQGGSRGSGAAVAQVITHPISHQCALSSHPSNTPY